MTIADNSVEQRSVALGEALAARRVYVTMTVQHQNRWISFRSRTVAARDGLVVVEVPPPSESIRPEQVLPEQECGINFRLNSYRYFCSAVVSGPADWPCDDGRQIRVMAFQIPAQVEKVERRAFERLDVPSGQIVRACVWVGSSRKPFWYGSVLNVSMGGFQMRATLAALNFFEPGDVASASLSFGAEGEPVLVQAHFRHGDRDATMSLLGFEFASLNMTPQGQEAMRIILAKLDEFRQAGAAQRAPG